MLAIRLQRVGRKNKPFYRVVVSEKSKDMYGNHLEILGQYNPHSKEASLKEDRIKHWLSVGAQASASVNNLLIKEGLLEGNKRKSVSISKKRTAKKEGKKTKEPVENNKEEKTAEPSKETVPEAKEEKKEAPVDEPKK